MKTYSFQIIIYILLISGNLIYSQDDKVHEFKINPTNGVVNIEIGYSNPTGGNYDYYTDIEVYTLNGQLITKIPVQVTSSGIYTTFYLTEYTSGIYLIKIYAYGYLLVSRLLLIK